MRHSRSFRHKESTEIFRCFVSTFCLSAYRLRVCNCPELFFGGLKSLCGSGQQMLCGLVRAQRPNALLLCFWVCLFLCVVCVCAVCICVYVCVCHKVWMSEWMNSLSWMDASYMNKCLITMRLAEKKEKKETKTPKRTKTGQAIKQTHRPKTTT